MGTIALVNSAALAWYMIAKAADEARSASVALAADAELKFTMLANAKYFVRLVVFFDTVAAADFKWRHVGPASPTLVRLAKRWIIPGGTAWAGVAVDTAFSSADNALTGTGTTGGHIRMEGVIHNGANAGNFSFNWAQNTSDAGATIVRAGSTLEYAKV